MEILERRIHVPRRTADRIRSLNIPPEQGLVVTTNYAVRPLPEAILNPQALLPILDGGVKDVTAFYSRSRPLSEEALAERAAFDEQARVAAVDRGGLRMYLAGSQLPNPDDLQVSPDLGLHFVPDAASVCIWDSLAQAKAGSSTSEHANAATANNLRAWYEGFGIKKYHLWTEPGEMPDGSEAEVIVFRSKPLQAAA